MSRQMAPQHLPGTLPPLPEIRQDTEIRIILQQNWGFYKIQETDQRANQNAFLRVQ